MTWSEAKVNFATVQSFQGLLVLKCSANLSLKKKHFEEQKDEALQTVREATGRMIGYDEDQLWLKKTTRHDIHDGQPRKQLKRLMQVNIRAQAVHGHYRNPQRQAFA